MHESNLTNMQLERRIERIESRLNNPDHAFHTIEWLKPLRDEDREKPLSLADPIPRPHQSPVIHAWP